MQRVRRALTFRLSRRLPSSRRKLLRDGAAAQYGSDAIAGVLNFVLRDDAEGMTFEARTGEFTEGDGTLLQFMGNVGLPLGDDGFLKHHGYLDGTGPDEPFHAAYGTPQR